MLQQLQTPRLCTLFGSKCTNLFEQKSMDKYCIHQSDADTTLFAIYGELRESATLVTSWLTLLIPTSMSLQLSSRMSFQVVSVLSGSRKVDCCSLVSDEMRNCIIQLHCMTGCDANSGFYGKGKLSIFWAVAKSPHARRQLSQCGNSLELDDEVLEGLFQLTQEVIYDKMTSNMTDARASKWKKKN